MNVMNLNVNGKWFAGAKINIVLFALTLGLAACGGAAAPYQNPNSPFEAVSAPDSGPPLLKVENGTDVTANIDCTGASTESLSVPPGELRDVRLTPGTYSCKLHGGDATPYTWSETYSVDTVYTFKAIMQTSYR